MESFSLLKYWRGGGGTAAVATMRAAAAITTPANPPLASETDDDDGDDGGPFFDLEFAVPDSDAVDGYTAERNEAEDGEEQHADDKELILDESLHLSSSDDLFFKGKLIAAAASDCDLKPQLSVSLLRSATKFSVFTFRLRKPKSPFSAEPNVAAAAASTKQSQQLSKFFIKFKVEEVPIASLFSREGSSRNLAGGSTSPSLEEKRSGHSKEVLHKYLSKIKPLYIRVSKRYAEKLKFSGPLFPNSAPAGEPIEGEEAEEEPPAAAAAPATRTGEKWQKPALPSRLRVAYKHLGKSKSASEAAVASVASPPLPPQRRDDTLLQQQDGIQGAIAHCKRSFTAASKDSKWPFVPSKSDLLESCCSGG